jgi:hypothetical protein
VGPEITVELVRYNAGFNTHPSFFCIEFKDAVHMTRYIGYNTGPHYLSCKGGAGRARNNAVMVLSGKENELSKVFCIGGTYDSLWKFFVH